MMELFQNMLPTELTVRGSSANQPPPKGFQDLQKDSTAAPQIPTKSTAVAKISPAAVANSSGEQQTKTALLQARRRAAAAVETAL